MTAEAAQAAPDPATTIDPDEVAKFSAMAAEWWDPTGKFAPLHKFNPVRLSFIRDTLTSHFGREGSTRTPLQGLRVLDIGCGGGLLSEPVTRMGATVTAVDASEANIKTASIHAAEQGLDIDYRHGTVEELAKGTERFDVILNMEVVEHVADVKLFMDACASLLKPGGLMLVATLNRTAKAFALAVVGAEYILGWLPKGTHDAAKFVRPSELRDALSPHGLEIEPPIGVSYNPLTDEWKLSTDTAVNYMLVAKRPA